MSDGSDTSRDDYLKSANRKLHSEAWQNSRRNPGKLTPAERSAVSELLSKVPEG